VLFIFLFSSEPVHFGWDFTVQACEIKLNVFFNILISFFHGSILFFSRFFFLTANLHQLQPAQICTVKYESCRNGSEKWSSMRRQDSSKMGYTLPQPPPFILA
jgi:hypothetical protein